MPCLYFDCESRSRINLKKVGPVAYWAHPSTTLTAAAWAVDDGPIEIWVPGNRNMPPVVGTGVTHNVPFDRPAIEYAARVHGWPVPKQFRCTAIKAAYHNLPRSLADVCVALGLAEKDLEGHKLMLKMCKPRRPTKSNPSEWVDDPHLFRRQAQYCGNDVANCREVDRTLPDIPVIEQALFDLDYRVNTTGVPVDIETIGLINRELGKYRRLLCGKMADLTDGEITSGSQYGRLKKWLATRGVEVENTQGTTLREVLASPIPDIVRDVISMQLEIGRSSTAKFDAMLTAAIDGRVHGCFMMNGAQQTGRWAGRRVQSQNAVATDLDQDGAEALIDEFRGGDVDDAVNKAASLVRPMIASPDKMLVTADSSQIELRICLWLAGDPLLDVFAQGGDPYKRIASGLYVTPESEVTDDQRQVGKMVILGCQFGAGWRTLQKQLAKRGVKVSDEESQTLVETFRRDCHRIKALWRDADDAAIAAVQYPGRAFTTAGGRVTYEVRDRWLRCRLPSGREISYFEPRLGVGKFGGPQVEFTGHVGQGRKWMRDSSYGGRFVENFVQATARDILRYAMFAVDGLGHSIVSHTHDELTVETDEPERAFADMLRILRKGPAWAEGLPLDAEGKVGRRYVK